MLFFFPTSLVAQTVKNLPAMWETWVWSLGWEDALEKEMATHSSTLAWQIRWTEESGGLKSMGSQRVRHNWVTNTLLTAFLRKKSFSYVDFLILKYIWCICIVFISSFWGNKGQRGVNIHLILFYLNNFILAVLWDLWILVPWPRIEPGPQKWKLWVLTTGPPGNSPHLILNTFIFLNVYNPNDLILEEKVFRKTNNHLKTFESQKKKNVFLYTPSSSPLSVIFFDTKLLERNVSPCCTPCASLILSEILPPAFSSHISTVTAPASHQRPPLGRSSLSCKPSLSFFSLPLCPCDPLPRLFLSLWVPSLPLSCPWSVVIPDHGAPGSLLFTLSLGSPISPTR